MKKIINKFKSILLILYKIKWTYNKPKKANILVYDDASTKDLSFFLRKKKFEIFFNRYENLNLYVLFYSIIKNGFYNLRYNYKLNYFKFVSPKLVITLIDENPGFFRLKSMYPFAKYVSIQFFFKGESFFKKINIIKKKERDLKLCADISFVLGHNEIKRYSKVIRSKFIVLGSIKNNNFYKKNILGRKIKKILFISGTITNKNFKKHSLKRSVKLFNLLKVYCNNKKLKLSLLMKHNSEFISNYKKIYGSGDWNYIPRTSVENTYKEINKADLVVFLESTLGFEALSKNIKGVCFPIKFPHVGYGKNYALNQGLFWSKKIEKKVVFSKINYVVKLNNTKWKKIIKTKLNKILTYNPKNKVFFKNINKFIK